ncbi:unnamed protein product [Darwinula stevensoni]|uniref:Uncharacterized protein n=1 Tax=Darwinula stevensoni TaxID=69355 RepID=A0A7R9A9J0_9CRUS|nr:unnamed protein product [Darwinula stevensoni]CAG0897469.1 unnamed protein product [Darwinula stevensoni]
MVWTFFPQGEVHKCEEMHGLLLFAQDDSQRITTRPIVPRHQGGDIWMEVDKLPRVYGEGQIITTNKILFRGKIKVTWKMHTKPLLRSLDRELARLPPLSQVSPRKLGRSDVGDLDLDYINLKWPTSLDDPLGKPECMSKSIDEVVRSSSKMCMTSAGRLRELHATQFQPHKFTLLLTGKELYLEKRPTQKLCSEKTHNKI